MGKNLTKRFGELGGHAFYPPGFADDGTGCVYQPTLCRCPDACRCALFSLCLSFKRCLTLTLSPSLVRPPQAGARGRAVARGPHSRPPRGRPRDCRPSCVAVAPEALLYPLPLTLPNIGAEQNIDRRASGCASSRLDTDGGVVRGVFCQHQEPRQGARMALPSPRKEGALGRRRHLTPCLAIARPSPP